MGCANDATSRTKKAITSERQIKANMEPGRWHADPGLYLLVESARSRRWVLRVVVHGKRRDIGLGSYPGVSLAQARRKAEDYRRDARDGKDPLAEKKKRGQAEMSFEDAAREVHVANKPSWRNAKHAAQWISTLEAYAFPIMGNVPIAQVESSHVLQVLNPIWLTKPETARRVRQRMSTVFDWANAAGRRSMSNPVHGIGKALPKQTDKPRHHPALPYSDISQFLAALTKSSTSEPIKAAIEFLILTAARTGEVLGARWEEFDLERGVWIVPAERMKAKKAHRVPLSPRAMSILNEAGNLLGRQGYVFHLGNAEQQLSNMALLMPVRRMAYSVTVHGFRSAFRDWAAERTNFPREVAEAALAHVVENDTERAYRRSDLFEKRQKLMLLWDRHVAGQTAQLLTLSAAA